MRWERGNISYVFNCQQPTNQILTILDNAAHIFTDVVLDRTSSQYRRDADLLMATENVSTRITAETITFSRVQTGWLFKEDKRETVGGFKADVFDLNGLDVELKLRGEHLSAEDFQNRGNVFESLVKEVIRTQNYK